MNPPACRGMGAHCRGVRVTVRVGETDDHEAYFDAVATWLLGHTERIEFGEIYDKGDDMLVDATDHGAGNLVGGCAALVRLGRDAD